MYMPLLPVTTVPSLPLFQPWQTSNWQREEKEGEDTKFRMIFYPLISSIFSKPKWCEIQRQPHSFTEGWSHRKSGMAEAEPLSLRRGGYRAAFPAQGQPNPSKSLAGWLCSLSSSQSPASASLATCLPLGRTRGGIWGSKRAMALGKCCSREPLSTHFLLKWKAVFSRPLISEAKWRTSHLSQGISLHFSSDFNKNLDDKNIQSSVSNLES